MLIDVMSASQPVLLKKKAFWVFINPVSYSWYQCQSDMANMCATRRKKRGKKWQLKLNNRQIMLTSRGKHVAIPRLCNLRKCMGHILFIRYSFFVVVVEVVSSLREIYVYNSSLTWSDLCLHVQVIAQHTNDLGGKEAKHTLSCGVMSAANSKLDFLIRTSKLHHLIL